MKIAILVVFACASLFAEEETLSVDLDVGTSHTLRFESISQAAVSDGKVLRLRQADDRTLVLTARKVGTSTVRVWEASGRQYAYQVQVLASGRLSRAQGADLGVVRVRLQIVEVSENARRQLGIHWPNMLDIQAMGMYGVSADSVTSPAYRTEGGVRFSTGQGWLRQLMEKGFAKLLSQPDLLVVLGEQASVSSGGEVPYPVLTESYGRLQQSIHWKNYGLLFKVRPEFVDGLVIRSDVQVEISDLISQSGTQNIPSVFRRSLNTKVNSRDGETVFLSGLIRQSRTHSKGEVPFLAEIPVLGVFFQERGEASESSEVVIAMTLGLTTRMEADAQRKRMEKLTETQHD